MEKENLINKQEMDNKILIGGDFSITGVDDQLPSLSRLLAGVKPVEPENGSEHIPFEIDLSGIEALDTAGIQLLAVFFRTLRNRNINGYLLRLSEEYRQKIQLLGFGDEIFAGERS